MRLNFFQNQPVPATREKILLAAYQIFAQKDFQTATISEIAQAAGVGDATIYEYFRNKEDLLFEIPQLVLKDVFEEMNLHMQGIEGAFNKIRKFIWLYFWFLENNPEWTSISMLNLRQNSKFSHTKSYEHIREWSRHIIRMVEEGKQEGIIGEEVEPNLVRDLLLGFMEHIAVRWLLMKKPPKLTPLTNSVTEMVIHAIKKETDPK